jgi:hypothetical protein
MKREFSSILSMILNSAKLQVVFIGGARATIAVAEIGPMPPHHKCQLSRCTLPWDNRT